MCTERRNKDMSRRRQHIIAPDDDNIIIAGRRRRRKWRIAAFIINFEYWRAICRGATQLATKSHNIVGLIRFGGTMTSSTAAAIRIKLHQVVIVVVVVVRSLDGQCSDRYSARLQPRRPVLRAAAHNCVWRIDRAPATAVEDGQLSQPLNDDDDNVVE